MSLTPDEQRELDELRRLKAQSQQPAVSAPKSMSNLEMAGSAIWNFPSSAYELGKSTFEAVTSPIQTGKAIVDLGSSVLGKIGVTNASPEMADRVGQFYSDRYGSLEKARQTFANDPAGFLADASTVLFAGGGALRALPKAIGHTGGVVGRAGETVTRVAEKIDPLAAAIKAPTKAASYALGLTTGAGSRAIEEAAKAGYAGGGKADAFASQMRGTAPVNEVVDTIQPAIENLRLQRTEKYKQGMGQIATDPTVLNFQPIRQAMDNLREIGRYKGKELNEPAITAYKKLDEILTDWENSSPADFHTPEGLDKLKQKIWNQSKGYAAGSPERLIADQLYNSVKAQIVKQAPKYATVMKDYEVASDLLREIEGTLSQNRKASIDTKVRKLQSILRNNANTNYGRRVELGEMLAQQGAENLFPQLAGQALSAELPRGLSGNVFGAGAAYSTIPGIFAGATNPLALAGLALGSPRAVGETAFKVGQVAGAPSKLAKALAQYGDALTDMNPSLKMAVDRAKRTLAQGRKLDPELARNLAYQLGQFERATTERNEQ